MLFRRFFRLAVPVFALAGVAFALSGCRHRCGWHSDPQKRADWIARKVASELDLDAAQKARLDTIKADILARQSDFRAVHAGLKDLFLGQIRASAVDTAAIGRGFEEREAKMKELRGFLTAEFAAFHAILTPAQREKLAAHLERMGGRCH